MNPAKNQLATLSQILHEAQAGTIVLPENSSVDSIAASTALYLGLTRMGKNVTLVSSGAVNSDLAGADKFQTNIATSGDNLVISLPFKKGGDGEIAVDRVDYYPQGTNLNVVITPRTGHPKLDPKDVKYSYTGGEVDFIITLDAPSLKNLGVLYSDNQELFGKSKIINIDRHLTNTFFGASNIVSKAASSTSQIVLSILRSLNVELDPDMATNLYAGLVAATNNFTSYSVNAETFEAAAHLLKMGAKKRAVPKVKGAAGRQEELGKQNLKTVQDIEREPVTIDDGSDEEDWLKPKIFGGGGKGGGDLL